ncbi:MAG: hypothetical protein N4A50_06300 [Vallitalea sp.]|nr:hypothetical protein [Vallitalea sp.]
MTFKPAIIFVSIDKRGEHNQSKLYFASDESNSGNVSTSSLTYGRFDFG